MRRLVIAALAGAALLVESALWCGAVAHAQTPPPLTLLLFERATGTFYVVLHGAVCNGSANDTGVLQGALSSSVPTVQLPAGTCRATSTLTLSSAKTITGGPGSTLLFDFVGPGLTGSAALSLTGGFTVDGNGKATNLVTITGADFRSSGIVFRNVYNGGYGDGSAVAVSLVNATTGEVRGGSFTNVHSLANGTEGDNPGAARGLRISGAPTQFLVTGVSFTDVHSVNGSGTKVMEDGDAIHLAGPGTCAVTVEACSFSNIGKRFGKAQCDGSTWRDLNGVASWTDAGATTGNITTGTKALTVADATGYAVGNKVRVVGAGSAGADLLSTITAIAGTAITVNDNAGTTVSGAVVRHADTMYAALSLFGSNTAVEGGEFTGTGYQLGVAFEAAGSGNSVTSATVSDSATYFDTGAYGQRTGIALTSQTGPRLAANRVTGFKLGVKVDGGSNVSITGGDLTSNSRGLSNEGSAVTGLALAGVTITGRSNASGPANIGAYILTGSTHVAVSGCTFRTLYDGVYFGGTPAASSVVGCDFTDLGRMPVFEQASSAVVKAGNARDSGTVSNAIGDRLWSGLTITSGTAAPAADEPVGSLYLRTSGGAATTLYVKTATGGAGWTAK